MKKILCLLLCFMFCNSVNFVYARDYTKLQEKEMKHAQKYGMNVNSAQYSGTHNTKGLLGDYEEIDEKLYQEKLKKDEVEYAKIKEKFETRTIDNYNAEAKGEDYYHIYRIVERLIRANNLEFMNWRIGIYRSTGSPVVSYQDPDYIEIPTSLYDTFLGNDSAIAFAIANSLSHFLLGHQKRRTELAHKIYLISHCDITGLAYITINRKKIIEEKNIEFASDVEALNLIVKAGYDINEAMQYIDYFKSTTSEGDFWSEIANTTKQIANCKAAIENIPITEYNIWGKYNLYNSEVLQVNQSSDRKSFTILKSSTATQKYHTETLTEYYLRCGYAQYVNKNYKKSIKYFDKYFKLNTKNQKAYIYASYAKDALKKIKSIEKQ